MTPTFALYRDNFGRLTYERDGQTHVGVAPVRAFPIDAPDTCIALVSSDGTELEWIVRLSSLPDKLRQLIEAELATRDFIPEIRRIREVSTFATPSTWFVETDRGDTSFILMGEEGIRRLPGNALLIADSHGIQFLIREPHALDRQSRKILDRFL